MNKRMDPASPDPSAPMAGETSAMERELSDLDRAVKWLEESADPTSATSDVARGARRELAALRLRLEVAEREREDARLMLRAVLVWADDDGDGECPIRVGVRVFYLARDKDGLPLLTVAARKALTDATEEVKPKGESDAARQ